MAPIHAAGRRYDVDRFVADRAAVSTVVANDLQWLGAGGERLQHGVTE